MELITNSANREKDLETALVFLPYKNLIISRFLENEDIGKALMDGRMTLTSSLANHVTQNWNEIDMETRKACIPVIEEFEQTLLRYFMGSPTPVSMTHGKKASEVLGALVFIANKEQEVLRGPGFDMENFTVYYSRDSLVQCAVIALKEARSMHIKTLRKDYQGRPITDLGLRMRLITASDKDLPKVEQIIMDNLEILEAKYYGNEKKQNGYCRNHYSCLINVNGEKYTLEIQLCDKKSNLIAEHGSAKEALYRAPKTELLKSGIYAMKDMPIEIIKKRAI